MSLHPEQIITGGSSKLGQLLADRKDSTAGITPVSTAGAEFSDVLKALSASAGRRSDVFRTDEESDLQIDEDPKQVEEECLEADEDLDAREKLEVREDEHIEPLEDLEVLDEVSRDDLFVGFLSGELKPLPTRNEIAAAPSEEAAPATSGIVSGGIVSSGIVSSSIVSGGIVSGQIEVQADGILQTSQPQMVGDVSRPLAAIEVSEKTQGQQFLGTNTPAVPQGVPLENTKEASDHLAQLLPRQDTIGARKPLSAQRDASPMGDPRAINDPRAIDDPRATTSLKKTAPVTMQVPLPQVADSEQQRLVSASSAPLGSLGKDYMLPDANGFPQPMQKPNEMAMNERTKDRVSLSNRGEFLADNVSAVSHRNWSVDQNAYVALRNATPAALSSSQVILPVIQQMAETIRLKPNRSIEVSINPEELGRVRISMAGSDGQMSVSINAARPETADLMRQNLGELAQEFHDLGYEDVSFSFDELAGEPEAREATHVISGSVEGGEKAQHITIPGYSTGIDVRI